MFTSISWQTYLIALLSIVTIYYLCVLLLFYRAELWALKSQNQTPQNQNDFINNSETDSVMGSVKQDESYSSVSSEELQFHHETEREQIENHLIPISHED